MKDNKTLTPRLVIKLWLAISVLIIGMAVSYILVTNYYSDKYHLATQQKINAPLAQHLIDEKFAQAPPFLEDGSVNKAMFGDLMHDMMAVNRSIEVYLLGKDGEILHSVVLSDKPDDPIRYVDTKPINDFITSDYQGFCLGDDPRNPETKKIFSVAPFEYNNREGFIYIILSGEAYQVASTNIFNEYIKSFGMGAIILTTIFTLIIGFVLIWFITKNLRKISQVVKSFKDGDMNARISQPEKTDISLFAHTFNEMADSIKANLDDIKSVDELRRNLIANVSHDLRTPVAILKGYADTLLEKDNQISKEDHQKYLKIISSNSDKLTNLVEQLFEYSKLEAKQIEPIIEQFSITDLCLDIVSKYDIIAQKKNINLTLEVEKSENILVHADLGLIERAIQNLIDNAIKFTPENGEVTVVLEKANNSCVVKVNDSGIGIDPEMQESIFDRFKQSSTSFAKNGAGLGLAIVRKILELHNGTIAVFSNPNQGSTFIFNLPVVS